MSRRRGATARSQIVHETRAALAARRGDDATREAALREARRLFTEMGAPRLAERVAQDLASSVGEPSAPSAS